MTLAPNYSKSVTAADYNDNPRSGVGLHHLFIPVGRYGTGEDYALPYDLPHRAWSNANDRIMRSAIKYESLWSSAIVAGIAQSVGMDFEIEGGPTIKKRYKDLLNLSDGGLGWKSSFLPRIRTDFDCTNNGYFFEIERSSRSSASRVTGLHSLDSTYCERTGDPDFPVIYTDGKGREHVMPWYSICFDAQAPSSAREDLRRGTCAASMAWFQIVKLAAIERYLFEKITGKGIQSLEIIVGIDDVQLEQIVNTGKIAAQQDDTTINRVFVEQYMGSIISGVLGREVQHISVPLKGFPDNFDPEKERGWALNMYANAVGLDPQILAPLIGGELGGTSRQSETLQGYRDQRTSITFEVSLRHKLNDWVLPNDTTFYLVTVDLNKRIKEAEAKLQEAEVLKLAQEQGWLQPVQAQAMAADQDIIDDAFVSADQAKIDGMSEHDKQTETPNAPDATGQTVQSQNNASPVQAGTRSTAKASAPSDVDARRSEVRDRGQANRSEGVTLPEDDQAAAEDLFDEIQKALNG